MIAVLKDICIYLLHLVDEAFEILLPIYVLVIIGCIILLLVVAMFLGVLALAGHPLELVW